MYPKGEYEKLAISLQPQHSRHACMSDQCLFCGNERILLLHVLSHHANPAQSLAYQTVLVTEAGIHGVLQLKNEQALGRADGNHAAHLNAFHDDVAGISTRRMRSLYSRAC